MKNSIITELDLTASLKLTEPQIGQRQKAIRDNKGTNIGFVLRLIAIQNNVLPDSDAIKSLKSEPIKKALDFYEQFNDFKNNVERPPNVPEVTIEFEPFVVNGVEYSNMILREPTMWELDKAQTMAMNGNDQRFNQENATSELLLECSSITKQANGDKTIARRVIQRLPVTAFDKATIFFSYPLVHFAGIGEALENEM